MDEVKKIIKVRYIGKKCFEFDPGEERIAGFLRDDPDNDWYVIESRDGDGEYAFPRELFEIIETDQ